MGCNATLPGWRSKDKTVLGKRAVTFVREMAHVDQPVNVPCGKCFGCKLQRARDWAVRCTHEAKMWEENSYVTLTYDDEHLPKKFGVPSLEPKNFVLFMKKIRHWREGRRKREDEDCRVRFMQCGEYGELGRPHHHAILFNVGFADVVPWRKTAYGNVFRSKELERLWPFGHSEIGEVCAETAGYVARYTMKKVVVRNQLGKIRVGEYMTMSRRPGIGKLWLDKFGKDVYPSDEVVVSGKAVRPPRYYDEQLKKVDAELLEEIRQRRVDRLREEVKSGARECDRERILRRKAEVFKRSLP